MSFVHANDAAMGDSSYERVEDDFYATEEWCTEALIRTLQSQYGMDVPRCLGNQIVLEPACGDGAITKVLNRFGYGVISTDLVDRGFVPQHTTANFLERTTLPHLCRSIITNPPYGDIAQRFVEHALALTKPVEGQVCMLMRHEWDCAKGRTDLFQSANGEAHPFKAKIVLTSRPRWIAGSTGAPRHNYAWYVWDWRDIASDRRPLLLYADKRK